MMGEYPTDEELERIRTWQKPDGWFEAVRSLWWMPDWGWDEGDAMNDLDRPVRRYRISTGGWSGNEDIIEAMSENFVLWSLSWVESRRGGHFIFEMPDALVRGGRR